MYNGKTVSLKTILWEVMQNPWTKDLAYEDAAEYASTAIKLIGATLGYINKVTNPKLKVINFKTELPPDLIIIRGARAFTALTDTDAESIPMSLATDIFHKTLGCYEDSNATSMSDFGFEVTYMIQSNILTASFKDGYVEVAYQALPTDDDGFPLVPDNMDFKEAVRYYILFRHLENLWTIGKVTDKVFNYIDTKKCFYMGAAQADMQLAGMDHVGAMFNSINRLIINTNAQQNFFKFMGKKERIRKYN